MNQEAYIKAITEALSSFDESLRKEMIEDFEEHFEIGRSQGKSDEEIIESLGSIEELVKDLKSEPVKQETQSGPQPEKAVPEIRKAVIEGLHGDVHIRVSKTNEARVEFKYPEKLLDKLAYKMSSVQENDTLVVKVEPTRKIFNSRFSDLDIMIELPNHMERISTHTLSGDITMTELCADSIQMETASGDISISKAKGDVKASAVSGDIYLREIDGELSINSTSGDIRIRNLSAPSVQIKTVSGDIGLEAISESIRINTVSGDAKLTLSNQKNVQVSTISGDFIIDSQNKDSGLTVDFSSTSGDLNVNAADKSMHIHGSTHGLVFGNGSAHYILSSISGDFRLNH